MKILIKKNRLCVHAEIRHSRQLFRHIFLTHTNKQQLIDDIGGGPENNLR